MLRKLHLDIETYSSTDIKTAGLYKYMESDDFEIILLAYAIDDQPVKIVDVEKITLFPKDFIDAMLDPNVVKCAHNAAFERNAFNRYQIEVPIEQWECTAIKSAYCGLPLGLDMVSKALNLEDKGKLSTGKSLIKYFCTPCAPTKRNGERTRNRPEHDPEKWEEFKRYCIRDVEAEREIDKLLGKYELPKSEKINYMIDQIINDRGIMIDATMAANAIEIDNKFAFGLSNRVKELTGVDNPNSSAQLKRWLSDATGENIETLAKENVAQLIEETEDETVLEVLDSRTKLAKSSTKKYLAMINCICEDQRAHGLFQFYGANRTGRWAGRLVQVQNLPQNHMPDLADARSVIASGDYELATMLYGNIPKVLSELIRTTFVAPNPKTFAVADFSAIEARVLSWLAGEEWRLEVFRTHGKIYEASAAAMFNVPIETVTKGSELRQKGKIAELALGYQGSVGALRKMGGEKMGLSESEMKTLVLRWRKANSKIVKLWEKVEYAAVHAIKSKKPVNLGNIKFSFDGVNFMICLPSGRSLFYRDPKVMIGGFGKEIIMYKGVNQDTKQWGHIDTYGGKLVENIIQAISRDLLAESMQKIHSQGFEIVMHVHDEIVCEVPVKEAEEKLKIMCNIMGEKVRWASGLPLTADGYLTPFYKKD